MKITGKIGDDFEFYTKKLFAPHLFRFIVDLSL
jgi:hypothetical protein